MQGSALSPTTPIILSYDGTFEGWLTAVFEIFEQKLTRAEIQPAANTQSALFSDKVEVITDPKKADRVWKGIKVRIGAAEQRLVYRAFLSELPEVENVMLRYVQHGFNSGGSIAGDYTHPDVLKIAQIDKSIGREKHRMEAFVRFKLTKDGIYFANIEPDFNVLPLIVPHFKKRYADQKWMIYDIKRDYGYFYDLDKVELVELQFNSDFDPTKTSSAIYDESELAFQRLWRDYFKSTNIESRKNMRLHTQHVPKRYWKYLSEKLPNI